MLRYYYNVKILQFMLGQMSMPTSENRTLGHTENVSTTFRALKTGNDVHFRKPKHIYNNTIPREILQRMSHVTRDPPTSV